jgi:3-methyl-2-oxobutanoate hydroxymethyltransferase
VSCRNVTQVNAVKLEGGKRSAAAVRAIHEAGIAVMGHVGLTPASVSALGGFRSFGKTSKEAMAVLEDALAIQVCVQRCVGKKA